MLNVDDLKKEFIGKTFNWLTVLDVYRANSKIMFRCQCKCGEVIDVPKKRVMSNNTKSCGCRVHSKEKFDKWLETFNSNNSRQKLSELAKNRYENEPDRLNVISCSNANRARKTRKYANWSKLLSVVHPKYADKILSGELISTSIIETKCPRCGKFSTHSINSIFIIATGEFKSGNAPICRDCLNAYNSSKVEQEIADYISTFYTGECIRNSRDIISPLELDLYYPEKKIAVEFNGDYWHSELFKDKDYHYSKFKSCLDQGVVLVSIFENEWNTRCEEIKIYLYDLFSGIENKLSFIDNSTMNNNYPTVKLQYTDSEYVSNYYTCGNSKVYTCGYPSIKIN